eukprot:scaffold5663_cov96-Skeletonema_dohrnii-CCMP3373.AAC.5
MEQFQGELERRPERIKFKAKVGVEGLERYVEWSDISLDENGRQYGATARIRGVLDYVALVGINAMAGVISPDHAENVRRKCMSLLITWEGTAGDFGKKQEIEASNLNIGIIDSSQRDSMEAGSCRRELSL